MPPHAPKTANATTQTRGRAAPSLCADSHISKNAARVYQLLDAATLHGRIKARVFEALLDDFYPQDRAAAVADLRTNDAARADLLTDEDMRSILDKLAARWNLKSLSKETVYRDTPQHLKAASRYKGDDAARAENARRKSVFYAVIRIIPPLVTVNALMAYGLYREAAERLTERLNAVSGQRDKHGLITAKWNVLIKCYQRALKDLSDMQTTPFTETDLQDAKAQLDALKRARTAPYDNTPLSGSQQAVLLGVDNRTSAVRLSKRLGLRREERSERRPLEVKRIGDAPLQWGAVQSAVKSAVSKGERVTHVFTYDENGKPYDNKPFEELDTMRLGKTFEVHVQMTSIIHVEAKPPRKERVKAADQPAAADTPEGQQAAIETAPRRVYRTTLYTRQWIERNLLAPYLPQHETPDGNLWVNPETGETFEAAADALLSLIDESPPADVLRDEVS